MGKKRGSNDEAPAAAPFHGAFAGLADLTGMAPAESSAPTSSDAPTEDGPVYRAKLVLRREKKGRGGKTVTVVEGIRPEAIDALKPRLKKALGCGAKREDDTLVLLGDVGERAAKFFEKDGARRVIRGN